MSWGYLKQMQTQSFTIVENKCWSGLMEIAHLFVSTRLLSIGNLRGTPQFLDGFFSSIMKPTIHSILLRFNQVISNFHLPPQKIPSKPLNTLVSFWEMFNFAFFAVFFYRQILSIALEYLRHSFFEIINQWAYWRQHFWMHFRRVKTNLPPCLICSHSNFQKIHSLSSQSS